MKSRLVVEVDGGQHADQKNTDADRTHALEALGFRVIRFWNNDVLKDINLVCETILKEARSPVQPFPLPEGEGGRQAG